MAGRAAILVDLDSMNVLFKWEDKFVAALNYSAGVDRLGELLPALGAGYDIYLCMKPRGVGEGDLVIDELSMTGLPFTVDSEELYQVLKFFRDYSGFGEVYLCNWVQNFIAVARVNTFRSVVYYGNRVALMQVKDGLLENFEIFQNQRVFFESLEDEYRGYGDVGLVDIDGIKAQYPEISGGSKTQITAIAPVLQCYRTAVKMETSDLFEQLKASRASGVGLNRVSKEKPEKPVAPVDDVNAKAVSREPPEPKTKPIVLEEPEDEFDDLEFGGSGSPVLTKVLLVACCLFALCFGALAGVVLKTPEVTDNSAYYNQVDNRVVRIQELMAIYDAAPHIAEAAREAVVYCSLSELPVTVTSFEYGNREFTVRCSASAESEQQLYAEYISEQYVVYSEQSLGIAEIEGQQVYQFAVVFGVQ